MNFSGKKMKIIASCLIAGGGIVTIASAAMLGVGTQYKYSYRGVSVEIGSLNYKGEGSYNDFVKAARDGLKTPGIAKEEKDLFNAIVLANDLMIADAVLVSISSLVLIAGIVLLVLNLKRQ